MPGHVLAIDQGTTSSRAILYDAAGNSVASAQQEFRQIYPSSGWVEHDASEIWSSVVETCRACIEKAEVAPADIAGIGITNQRETVVLWERETGKPVANAIVWQDRRTAEMCDRLKADGNEPMISERTGLLLDPYFSGTKIAWLLDTVAGARSAAESGKLCCGTIDSWLVWNLTGGRVHATDATNASRTMLFDIRRQQWDEELLGWLDVPASLLPEVNDCIADFGVTEPGLLGAGIPILGIAGDQQAAMIGQACFSPGMIKSTYGTGCFVLLNTGDKPVASNNRLLTTTAYRISGKPTYALEGSIFIAGAAVQWLRDSLGIIERADQTGPYAANADAGQDVILVPAFTGLGAPHWDAEARGAIFGLTRSSGPHEFARAALEAVCFQTADLLDAMRADWSHDGGITSLRVDGGMAASDWTMQRLADLLDCLVERPENLETTAYGAAWLAASGANLWPDMDTVADRWSADARFEPAMEAGERQRRLGLWQDAVRRTLSKT